MTVAIIITAILNCSQLANNKDDADATQYKKWAKLLNLGLKTAWQANKFCQFGTKNL